MVEARVSLVSSVKLATEPTKIQMHIWIISIAEPVCNISLSAVDVSLTLSLASPDLRAIGQTTKIARSTLAQVQARIAYLREKTKAAATAKEFDFDQRLAEIRSKERAAREAKKAEKKAEKEKKRIEMIQEPNAQDVEMAEMMGFAGFGTSKK